jgi:ABC-type branched-subunit amino acid transport system ATPase component
MVKLRARGERGSLVGRTQRALEHMGIAPLANVPAKSLPLVEQRALALAGAVAFDATLVFAEEGYEPLLPLITARTLVVVASDDLPVTVTSWVELGSSAIAAA